MSAPKLIRYDSPTAFRNALEFWNDLWQRGLQDGTDATPPSAGGESICLWLEHFAPGAKFVALAVEQDGQLIAGLPLVERRLKRAITVGSLPLNNWCWSGDLIVDPNSDVERSLELMAAEIRRLSWPLLWFEAAPLNSPRWQKFLAALKFVGTSFAAHEQFRIGTIEIDKQLHYDWEAYQAAWSGNHRRHMRKSLRRANEEGGVELDVRRPQSASEVESLLQEGFEVEHRSWKGGEQTSVLSVPAVWNYYRRQAATLAEHGNLELVFLRHLGKAIAFEYGWNAGGTYYTPKVGYDYGYARFSPGQLLRYLRLEQAFTQHDLQAVDFCGPLSEATAKWATSTYPASRLVVETGGSGGRALMWAYKHLWSSVRRWRRHGQESSAFEIVAVNRDDPAPLHS